MRVLRFLFVLVLLGGLAFLLLGILGRPIGEPGRWDGNRRHHGHRHRTGARARR